MIEKAVLKALPLQEMAVGEQIKANHTNCPAGVDTRSRLYVRRKETNLWLAYCHNCGDSGAIRSGSKGQIPAVDVATALANHFVEPEILPTYMAKETHLDNLPDDCTHATEHWEQWAVQRLWEHHTGVSAASLPPYNWSYSPSRDQIITPLYDEDRELFGYQARLKPGEKPKCITTYFTGRKGCPLVYRGTVSTVLFIVEDPLSAMRLNEERGAYTISLLGTHLNDRAVTSVLTLVTQVGIREIYVWMDDDAAGRVAANKIFSRLFPMLPGVNIRVMNNTQEPKKIVDLKGMVLP